MEDSTIISCVALIISFITPIFNYFMNRRVNDITLESQHLKDIYVEFLTQRIPEARRDIIYTDTYFQGSYPLQKVLLELLKALSFYKYIDNDFYMDVKIAIQKLEDYIVLNESEIFRNSEIPRKEIEKDLSDIYNIINTKYKNG